MNVEQLAQLVAQMRHAQKEYARTGTNRDECKRAEKKVDTALKTLSEQRTLFES